MSDDYQKIPVPEGSIISTDTMHETLQDHIASCGQCKNAIDKSGRDMTHEFGKRTKMCTEYLKIVQMFTQADVIGD